MPVQYHTFVRVVVGAGSTGNRLYLLRNPSPVVVAKSQWIDLRSCHRVGAGRKPAEGIVRVADVEHVVGELRGRSGRAVPRDRERAVPRQQPVGIASETCPHVVQRDSRSEEHTSELQSHLNLVCRLLLEKKKKNRKRTKETDSMTAPARTRGQ